MPIYQCICSFYVEGPSGHKTRLIRMGSKWECISEPQKKGLFKKVVNENYTLKRIYKTKTATKETILVLNKGQLDRYFKINVASLWNL